MTPTGSTVLAMQVQSLQAEVERLREALQAWLAAYPDFAQLIDGFKYGAPLGGWSEWDESVRTKLIALGLQSTAALSPPALQDKTEP